MKTYNEIKEYIEQLEIIDVHEHLIKDELRIQKYQDYMSLVFSNYVNTNAISAGISQEEIAVIQGNCDIAEKNHIYRKACENIQNTTSYRCMDMAFRHFYGMGVLDSDFRELNDRYCAANKSGFTYQTLKQMKVKWAVNDVFDISMQNTDYEMDKRIFKNSARCDKYIMIHEYLSEVEKEHCVKIESLEELCSVIKKYICMQKNVYHAAALKIAVAYYRSLYFEPVKKEIAEKIFQKIISLRKKGQKVSLDEACPLCDYIVHYIIAAADGMHLPIQIHTGLQDRNVNYLHHSHPLLLNNLFERYPDVTFILFHTGYPYGREAGILAKMFPNVYVDFSWVHAISSIFAIELMKEYFEVIPANKFCGFGGDFCNVEGAFGHLQLAKENLSLAIADLVERGWYSAFYGMHLAKQILYDNPKQIYGI